MLRGMVLAICVLFAAGAAYAGTPEENKAACKRFYSEAVNQGDFELFDELVSEDFVEHEVFPGLGTDRDSVREFFKMMRTAFPDLKFDVEFMLAEGDRVAAYLTMSGTHKGEFMGMPATGKRFEVACVDIIRMKDGKAVEHWGATDSMKMMQQLGAMPDEGIDEDAEEDESRY